MAIYHFSAKVISRAVGSSAVAAAAYRSAGRLRDDRLDRSHDFTNKTGVMHSEVMLPEGAPEAWSDREQLWNAVEAAELRKDAQLAREVEFAIPREMTVAQVIELARDFVQREFVSEGMVADLNVHWDVGVDGQPKPHAHVMLTMREVDEDGFGKKCREWNRTDVLEGWRERWAGHVNERLAALDIDARIDHRSLEAQGIELEPQNKIGPAAARMAVEGRDCERLVEHHAIARSNGDKILADPRIALDAITHQQSTFTTRELAMFVHRHSEGKDQFDQVMAAVRASPEIVKLGTDGRGDERFTSRSILETEQRLERATASLDRQRAHRLAPRHRDRALAAAEQRGLDLSVEQRGALEHVTGDCGLSSVVGYAGTGKSAMLGVAREAWERAGFEVRGAALSGIAAANLVGGSGIASRTIASLEHQWGQGRELLTDRSVLVVDEAGMIGTRQMERVVSEVQKRGAKLVLVGDPEQLQAIEAGAAFRSVAERHGAVEITGVRRQVEDWQRDATRQLATGRTGEAIDAYAEAGHVHAAETREQARDQLIERWERDRQAAPTASRIILTHTNDEVRLLNEAARERLRDTGGLGVDVEVQVERGSRSFATGDRVMFLKNERSLEVKNGTLGTVEQVTPVAVQVRTDDGRSVRIDLKDYAHLDHGYAATIHKAQGITVDRVHVLATPGMDRHGAYVAMTRHREGVSLHYGQDDFADQGRLVRTLSRERSKDMASDYGRAPEAAPVAEPKRGLFDGLWLGSAPKVQRTQPEVVPSAQPSGPFEGLGLNAGPLVQRTVVPPLERAVQRYAEAAKAMIGMQRQGLEPLVEQRRAFTRAWDALEQVQPGGAEDLRSAINRTPGLVDEAAGGQTRRTIRAMLIEGELRVELGERANRFVADWRHARQEVMQFERQTDYAAATGVKDRMSALANSLHRDPQLESLLRGRTKELGIALAPGQSLSQGLQQWIGHSRGRGLGL
ncbi:Ti-type conjugative transfer relaxase TraA [Sphingomonas sp. FW199]|uniref:Ti-type conjugative transfer relaxase TraA n=1 Tax=Sphingomonas sp. FW199 TaxID=3400217 RepID=UPI003CEBA88A